MYFNHINVGRLGASGIHTLLVSVKTDTNHFKKPLDTTQNFSIS